jgi:hypothetical protein
MPARRLDAPAFQAGVSYRAEIQSSPTAKNPPMLNLSQA